MKKLYWYLATSILLLAAIGTPVRLKADGSPSPLCPPTKGTCK